MTRFVRYVTSVLAVAVILVPAAGLGLLAIPASGKLPATLTAPVVNNVVDYGAIGDGSVANAAVNTAAFQAAIAAGGTTYVPPSPAGFVVNNDAIKISTPGAVIMGDASMGASSPGTSTIIGHGPGNIITVTATGCSVRGLAFKPSVAGEQKGSDAFVLVTGTQCSLRDLYMASPNTGISLQLPPAANGEFWIKDVLIGGTIGTSVITANVGNAAVRIDHVIAYNDNGAPQPPYGIVVTAAGELTIGGGTDIIQCGTCLAIVPGLGGVKGQFVVAIFVSDSLFDSGNGTGCVYIGPMADAYVLTVRFVNAWASTPNNGNGQWPTNGFTFDGSGSKPSPQLKPIQDVCLTNCVGKAFVNHCGVYAKAVAGLSIQNCSFGGCFNGIQIGPGCSGFILSGNKCGDYVPPTIGQPTGGNAAYGILIEPNDQFIVTGNLLYGNGKGGVINLGPVTPRQVIALNLF